MEGAAAVEISANGGADFSRGGLRYWYEPSPSVIALQPASIRASLMEEEAAMVTVYGKHFKTGRDLSCTLGASRKTDEAIFVSSTAIVLSLIHI